MNVRILGGSQTKDQTTKSEITSLMEKNNQLESQVKKMQRELEAITAFLKDKGYQATK